MTLASEQVLEIWHKHKSSPPTHQISEVAFSVYYFPRLFLQFRLFTGQSPNPAILDTMSLQFQPMPLRRRSLPFDDADWLFELKYDGFRALAVIEHGRAQLLSRTRSLPSLHSQNRSPIPCRTQERSLTAKFAPSIDVVDHSSKICCFAVGTRRTFSHSIC